MNNVHFTVGRRMTAGLGIVLLVLALVAATAFFALGRAGLGMRATAEGASLSAQAMELDLTMNALLRAVAAFRVSGSAEDVAAFTAQANVMRAGFAEVEKKAIDAESQAALADSA